jgi:hypothetical protein
MSPTVSLRIDAMTLFQMSYFRNWVVWYFCYRNHLLFLASMTMHLKMQYRTTEDALERGDEQCTDNSSECGGH